MNNIYLKDTNEFRRLYAIENRKGKLFFFLDQNTVFEMEAFQGGVFPMLECDNVQTFYTMQNLNGVTGIITKDGGHLIGYLLRRGYTTAEKARHIPKESDEATPAPETSKGKTPKKQPPVTIEEAALICHCSPSCIKKWESGKSTPECYPGRSSEVTLKSWQAHRNGQKIVKAAVMKEVSLGDGKAADIAQGKLWVTEHAAEVRRKNRED